MRMTSNAKTVTTATIGATMAATCPVDFGTGTTGVVFCVGICVRASVGVCAVVWLDICVDVCGVDVCADDCIDVCGDVWVDDCADDCVDSVNALGNTKPSV